MKETVVIPREDGAGDKRLIAYIVPRPGTETLDSAAFLRGLRQGLSNQLPDYMTPAAFVLLDAMPLTPNGKLDRLSLPAPESHRTTFESSYVASRDDLERELVSMWEAVLKVEPIGIHDNFFELGGHSLLAVTLFSRIQETFNRELPLATLFQAATVAELAALLRQKDSLSWRPLVPIQAGGQKPPIFCVHALSGNVLYLRDLAKHLGSEQPFYGLQAQGLDGEMEPLTNVEQMATNYIAEIRTVQPQGPYFLAGHSLGGAIAFEMAQQLYAAGETVAMVALFDAYSPILMQKGTPPWHHKLSIELLNLVQIPLEDKLGYLQERVQLVLNKLRAKLKKPGSVADLPVDERLRVVRKVEEANFKAVQNYVPKVYPGRITLFQSLQRWTRRYHEPAMGWDVLAAGGVEIHLCPGNHFSMILEPRVSVMATKFQECLNQEQ